jgi:transcriptional regulator with XRE-family HTH domain
MAPKEPKTLGEHLRKRRLERHLLQTQLARLFGVDRVSVQNWESGIYEPNQGMVPKIIEFLGYDPRSEPKNPIPR